jgi:hypothetical protein
MAVAVVVVAVLAVGVVGGLAAVRHIGAEPKIDVPAKQRVVKVNVRP